MAVLFDSLLLPDSDFGLDHTSPLEWRYEPERAVPHLVLGKGPPGGAWHVRIQNTDKSLLQGHNNVLICMFHKEHFKKGVEIEISTGFCIREK